MPSDTDSIPRVTARDMFMTLSMFKKIQETTLENIRLRLCVDRKQKRRGIFLWPTTRDIVSELRRLNLLTSGPLPRDRRQYENMREISIHVTEEGKDIICLFSEDRNSAYDKLFIKMYEEHLYLRNFVKVLNKNELNIPVFTSIKEHISSRYSSATILMDDISHGHLEVEDLLTCLQRRINRELSSNEKNNFLQEIELLVNSSQQSSLLEDPSDFAKKFLDKLNEIVVPGIFHSSGLSFDYRTHRTLWSLGQEFSVWWATTNHPSYDGTLVFTTADIKLSPNEEDVEKIEFNSGLQKTEENFLGKLYLAYQKYQEIKSSSYVPALELQAIFCYGNRCQPSIFNKLIDKYYAGSSEFKVHLEIQRSKPRHEKNPIVVGKRRIGTIRVTRVL